MKIKPLPVVCINGGIYVKVIKFDTLKNELKRGSSWLELLMNKTIITDVNDNTLSLEYICKKFSKDASNLTETVVEEMFKNDFLTIKIKCYIKIM